MHSWKMGVLEASIMPFEEGVDLLCLDARQVIAHGHVEDKAVGVAQAIHLGHDLQGAPGLHILLKGLLAQ